MYRKNLMNKYCYLNWRPPSLSELTPMLFNTGLTHLGSEASISKIDKYILINTRLRIIIKILILNKFKVIIN